jgi:NAD(P)-dependent dehydrogenase (short-subunit alcohol dehydrogenase family)
MDITMQASNTLRIFAGATAIVTGAASGIGRGLAEELAKRGCEVVLADLQIETAEQIAQQINAAGGKATAAKLDVTCFADVEKLITDTVNRTGRLDYMFNNAGIAITGNISQYSIDDWNQIIDVNLNGTVNGVQAAYQLMIKQGYGHIVNTSSLAGLTPSPGHVAYATTKHAIVGLSESLRAEAAEHGIRVSVLCPGFVRTAILDEGGKYGKSLWNLTSRQKQRLLDSYEKHKPMSANAFASEALDLVAKNLAIIVLPKRWKLVWLMCRIFPLKTIDLMQKPFQKMQKEMYEN